MTDITDYPERTTTHSIDGETVSYTDLEEGDTFTLRISWYDRTEPGRRPAVFEVTEPLRDTAKEMLRNGRTPMASVKARGSDGETYKIYIDNVHVECLTDDKDGYDRGTKAGRPQTVDDEPDDIPTYQR